MAPPIATSDIQDASPNVDVAPATDGAYTIREEPFGTPRKLRVGFIGAGVSGINFFKFAEEKLSNVDIVCWEKNKDVGGTWLENRYAGCACDIPSVNYQYRWRPYLWSKYYSPSPEIWEYLKMVEQENQFVEKYVKLEHIVTHASWTDEEAKWRVKIKNLVTGDVSDDVVDVLLNGGGILNNWKWPDTPGLMDFKGKLMHSASWDTEYDFTNKRVAVLGAGSSAVQLIPTLYPQVKSMHAWIRSPVWVTAGFAQQFAGKDGRNYEYTDEQKEYLRNHPAEYKAYRKMIEGEINQRFRLILQGTQSAEDAKNFSINEMKTKLKNKPALADVIIPKNFGVGCRRPTPGTEGFLEALAGEKTTVRSKPIVKITNNGFIGTEDDGRETEVDAIVCATGFETSFSPSFELRVNGDLINETLFSDQQKTLSYLSLALPGVPNYMTFCGAFGPVAHGSFFPLIEGYTNYAIALINKLQIERVRSVRPKWQPCIDFRRHAELFLKRTAWTGPCSSWFKNGKVDGLPLLWPGSRCSFIRLIENVRWEDWEIEPCKDGNIWSFLGNGFNIIENDEDMDNNWYLGPQEGDVDLTEIQEMMKDIELKGLSNCK